jgi:2-succinyl-6-hydroxy-2,4-cyclohexadiene-1-carboxylate synthase
MVLVPGFSQPASAWSGVLERLRPSVDAGAFEVSAVDVPDGLDFGATSGSIGAAGGTAVYVGYSMGGRLVLHLALDRPDLVAGLVLVSASPGIAAPDARAARAESDARLAAEVERDGVSAFLDRWLAQPLFSGLSRDEAGFDERVAATSVARLVHQLTVLGQGTMGPVWEQLDRLSMPVLLVTGERDAEYGTIATEMTERNPRFASTVLPGGHAVPLEQPGALAERLAAFVHELAPATE